MTLRDCSSLKLPARMIFDVYSLTSLSSSSCCCQYSHIVPDVLAFHVTAYPVEVVHIPSVVLFLSFGKPSPDTLSGSFRMAASCSVSSLCPGFGSVWGWLILAEWFTFRCCGSVLTGAFAIYCKCSIKFGLVRSVGGSTCSLPSELAPILIR